jgi:tetratricopeptide (TPR) repeat protein
MNPFSWLSNQFSRRRKAVSLLQRAMKRARAGNQEGAIADYSQLVDDDTTPADVRAMALYNRALVLAAGAETSKAITDLNRLLAMPEAKDEVKTEARRKLERMRLKTQRDQRG